MSHATEVHNAESDGDHFRLASLVPMGMCHPFANAIRDAYLKLRFSSGLKPHNGTPGLKYNNDLWHYDGGDVDNSAIMGHVG